MKNEIKLEWKDADVLTKFIESTYKQTENTDLKIHNRNLLKTTNEIKEQLKGCNNFVVKIYNTSVVEGFMRFLIIEKDDATYLDPISIYSIVEHNGKYIFM